MWPVATEAHGHAADTAGSACARSRGDRDLAGAARPGDTAAVTGTAQPPHDAEGFWGIGHPARRPRLPEPPAWFRRLTDLTVHGTGTEDRITGVVHARIEDDGGV